ncbi:hypothetical protein BX616_008702, partial [Lobosporangium transversale]
MTKMVREVVNHPEAVEWPLIDNLYHIPCLGHIINLAVQAMLGPNGLNDPALENDNGYSDDSGDEDTIGSMEVTLSTLQKLRKGIMKIRQ